MLVRRAEEGSGVADKHTPLRPRLGEMNRGMLGFAAAEKLLGRYGIGVEGKLARTRGEAEKIAADYGGSVAMKIISGQVVHKTDERALSLGVRQNEVGETFDGLMERFSQKGVGGILVQPMIDSHVQFLVGASRDPTFGEIVTVGFGGVYVEVVKDVVHGVSEITLEDARGMISRMKSQALLKGFRGMPAVEVDKLAEMIVAVSRLMRENPAIESMDLNPVAWGKDRKFHVIDPRLMAGEVKPKVKPGRMPAWKRESLDAILNPKSCALIGASTAPGSVPDSTVKSMLERSDGDIHLVNPKFEEGVVIQLNSPGAEQITDDYALQLIRFMEKLGKTNRVVLHNDTKNLPEGIDLGIFMTKAEYVIPEFEKFAFQKGKGAIIISDGFAEAGRKDLQDALVQMANMHRICIDGPNCLGILNNKVNTIFIPRNRTIVLTGSERSTVSIITQSGGNGLEVLEELGIDGVPVNSWVSCGNGANVSPTDWLEVLGSDDRVKAIALYVESVPNGVAFYEILKETCRKKPVVVMKGGRSEVGAEATATHTGAVTKNIEVFDSLCEQAGAFRVRRVKEMANVLSILATQKRPERNNVMIVTVGGGIGIVISDLAEEAGLAVLRNASEGEGRGAAAGYTGKISQDTIDRLRKVKGLEGAYIGNPLDILGSANNERLLEVIRILNEAPEVGVVYFTPYFQVPGLRGRIADEDLSMMFELVRRIERGQITDDVLGRLNELGRRIRTTETANDVFRDLGVAYGEMNKPLIISPRGDGEYLDYCRLMLGMHGVPTYTTPVVEPLAIAMKIWEKYPGVDFAVSNHHAFSGSN